MSSTYRPSDAIRFAKEYVKSMPVDRAGNPVQAHILSDVASIMWMAAPWRWTLGNLGSNVTVLAATQDYTVTLPGDFLYLADVYLADGQTTPRHLHVEPFLPPTEVQQGLPNKAAIIGSTILRIYPKPGAQPSTPPVIVSTYKKVAPLITLANMDTGGTQVFDDEWFWVYEEGVLWRAYQFADDQRAGSITYSIGSDGKVQMQFTGQRAAFEAGLEEMKMREKLPEWTYRQVPDAEARGIK